jgi:predicted RNA binding protein YcfA (HicA-like mRNA interferase family)
VSEGTSGSIRRKRSTLSDSSSDFRIGGVIGLDLLVEDEMRIALTPLVCIVCMYLVESGNVIKRLKADGWFLVHVKGSHQQFKHPTKSGRVTVPHPKKDLPIEPLRP